MIETQSIEGAFEAAVDANFELVERQDDPGRAVFGAILYPWTDDQGRTALVLLYLPTLDELITEEGMELLGSFFRLSHGVIRGSRLHIGQEGFEYVLFADLRRSPRLKTVYVEYPEDEDLEAFQKVLRRHLRGKHGWHDVQWRESA